MRPRTTIVHRRWAIVLGLAFVVTEAQGSELQELSWSGLLELVDAHPGLQAARSDEEAARQGIAVASQIPNPTLGVSAAHVRAPSPDASSLGREWGLELALPLDWLVRLAPERHQAHADADASRFEALALRRTVVEELGSLYWTLARDQAAVGVMEETEAQVADMARLVRLKVDHGESRPIEADRIEADLERIRIRREQARREEEIHRAQLAQWIGVSVKVGPDDPLPAIPGAEAVMDRVATEDPVLLAETARLESARARVSSEVAGMVPEIGVLAFRDNELDAVLMGGGLAVELPLWNWNLAGIRQARAERDAAEARVEWARRQQEAEILALHGRCLSGRDAVSRYEEQILPRAERSLVTMEKTFQVGETGLMDLLDTRRVVTETRQELEDTRLDCRLSCTALLARIGAFDEATR